MASLQEIFGWFGRGKFPTEDQYKNTYSSFWHKSEKMPIEQIFGLKEEIAKATTNFKGYHTSIADLQTAHPQTENKKDFYAWVGAPYPGTVYVVKANGSAWADTGQIPTQQQIDLAEYATKNEVEKKADEENTEGETVIRSFESENDHILDVAGEDGSILAYWDSTKKFRANTDFLEAQEGENDHKIDFTDEDGFIVFYVDKDNKFRANFDFSIEVGNSLGNNNEIGISQDFFTKKISRTYKQDRGAHSL